MVKSTSQDKKIQDIHKRKYLANMNFLPDLRQKKTKEYLQVIFTFAALIFASIFAINPTLTTITDLNRQLQDAQVVSDALQTKISNLSALNNQYTTLQAQLPHMYDAIPQSEEVHTFLAQLQALATTHQLSIIVLNANNQDIHPHGDPTQSLSFTLSANGSYQNIRSFLSDVINFQRIITIDTLSISRPTTGGNLLLTLSGRIYFAQ